MSQPTLQMPHEPLEATDPDDLESASEVCRPEVPATMHPFAGLGLHVGYSKKDRLVVVGLTLLYAVYAWVTRLQAMIGSLSRR
jgi:hypothetical protein